MSRDAWIKKLARIFDRIEAGESPVPITHVYVFGSFARGALEPNDLDLIVLHEAPPDAVFHAVRARLKRQGLPDWQVWFKEAAWLRSQVRRDFRRGSERMDIRVAQTLDDADAGLVKAPVGERVLLWTSTDRDWRSKVDAIVIDPAAGSHPRHQFVSPKRAGCTLDDVEAVMKMIDLGALTLRKQPMSDTPPALHTGTLAQLVLCHVLILG